MKIVPSNLNYWAAIGYKVYIGDKIKVKTEQLKQGSNVKVSCKCEKCNKKYIQRFCRNKQICSECRRVSNMKNNNYGAANKGKILHNISGEKHPNWNPNKSEYRKYCNKVRTISEQTYKRFKEVINPFDYPRKVCGVEGGWQLDHRISIKRGFMLGINPKIIGSLDNLQMLTWSNNRSKYYK